MAFLGLAPGNHTFFSFQANSAQEASAPVLHSQTPPPECPSHVQKAPFAATVGALPQLDYPSYTPSVPSSLRMIVNSLLRSQPCSQEFLLQILHFTVGTRTSIFAKGFCDLPLTGFLVLPELSPGAPPTLLTWAVQDLHITTYIWSLHIFYVS